MLEQRWPNTPLYGDVATLHGPDIVKWCGQFDLLSGGSPCQDLSQAGDRAGLAGARSGLFFHQMRLWRETGAEFCLWENVHGAFSSSKGRDFAAVLSAFVGDVIDLPTTKTGTIKWSNSGVVCGPSGVAAWRVFDARHWGVGQRRRRVFVLGSRTGVVDPAEILFESPSMPWHPTEITTAREATAVGSELRVATGTEDHGGAGASERSIIVFDWSASGDVGDKSFRGQSRRYIVRKGEYAGTLKAGNVDAILEVRRAVDFRHGTLSDVAPTIQGLTPGAGVSLNKLPGVLAFQERGREGGRNLEMQEDLAYAVTTKSGGGRSQEGNIISFYANSNGEDLPNADATCPPIKVGSNDKGTGGPAVIAFEVKQSGESSEDVAPTLRAMNFDKSHINGGGQVGVVEVRGQRSDPHVVDQCNDPNCPKVGGWHSVSGKCRLDDEWYGPWCRHSAFESCESLDCYRCTYLRSLPEGMVISGAAYAFSENQRAELLLTDYVHNVTAGGGKPGQGYPAVLETNRELSETEKHWGQPEEKPVARMLAFGHYEIDGTASAIKARDYKDATDIVLVGRPRRLIPRECEALMGWPKGWTEVPDAKGKAASDALRYKAVGNGVVSHIPQWIGERLGAAIQQVSDGDDVPGA